MSTTPLSSADDAIPESEDQGPPDASLTASEHERPEQVSRKRNRIDKFFKASVKMLASDVHFKANSPPRFRVGGKLRTAKTEPLENDRIIEMVFEILTKDQREHYLDRGSVDFAYALTEVDRFRVNVFRQRGLMSVAARRISKDIMGYAQLGLPESIGNLAQLHQGLVMLAGITGSGKSTTIAAMIEQINSERACHIVTLEDPIEYLFRDDKAFINQREIGIDVKSFADGLKYLMREDPDVVLIGEMRDAETFSAAIQAAESGHLVFATVHASGAAQTITRILELFPEDGRDLIRTSLAFNLQGIICQKLLPSIKDDVGRIPAVEIMIANPSIRKMVEEKRENEISTVLRSSYNEGMVDFAEYLHRLVETEVISPAVAYEAAPNPDELRMKLKGIEVSSGGLTG
jgi:twitching motility protein PilT